MTSNSWIDNMPRVFVLLALAAIAAPAQAGPEEEFKKGREAYYRDDLLGAMQLLRKAANQGHTGAQSLLAYILDKADEDQAAFELYTRAAEQGSAEGMYGLGTMYAAGEGVERDPAMALEWFRRAMDAGHDHALLVLANAYLVGAYGLAKDREQGLALLKQGAARGYEPARNLLAEVTKKQTR